MLVELGVLARYIVSRLGCTSPFHISRILVLANWEAVERMGEPLTCFSVGGFKAGFYIDGLKSVFEDNTCFVKHEDRKCVEYRCREPVLPGRVQALIDELINRTKSLGDTELNRLVIKDPRYEDLLRRGGFCDKD